MGGEPIVGHVTECPGHGNLAPAKIFQSCNNGTIGIAELVQRSVQTPSAHKIKKSSIVVLICNPSVRELEQEDPQRLLPTSRTKSLSSGLFRQPGSQER